MNSFLAIASNGDLISFVSRVAATFCQPPALAGGPVYRLRHKPRKGRKLSSIPDFTAFAPTALMVRFGNGPPAKAGGWQTVAAYAAKDSY
jgi:hypothetical protein